MLLALQPKGKINYSTGRMEVNPFLLSPSEKYFFLYCILESDGDLIRRLYDRLLALITFNNNDVGHEMSASLLATQQESTGTGKSELSRIMRAAEAGIKSGQILTTRLEPLVDCGLLRRTDAVQHVYEFNDGTRAFIQNLSGASSVGEFLVSSLASNMAFFLRTTATEPQRNIRFFTSRSYLQLRSGLGYCSIRELALLTVSNAIYEGVSRFEIDDVERELISLSKEYGSKVRFTKNRQGDIALVRIDRDLAENLYGITESK
ncbi:MAG: hypothetical protein HY673_04730 [Chloroflexi bacterium]|nr:hypothetical protein [Chloroflexota bacterium]